MAGGARDDGQVEDQGGDPGPVLLWLPVPLAGPSASLSKLACKYVERRHEPYGPLTFLLTTTTYDYYYSFTGLLAAQTQGGRLDLTLLPFELPGMEFVFTKLK